VALKLLAPRGPYVTKTLSDYDYRGFTVNPDELRVPTGFITGALPHLAEPGVMPSCPVPARQDHEPLVRLVHRGVRLLSPYWHAGWDEAEPGALVREGVAARLSRVCEGLPPGFGLAVFDAWRPLALQGAIFDAAYADSRLPAGFVTPPSNDPTTPPPHLTGGTVDLTLTWQGHPLALGTPFDDFTDDARADAFERTPGRVRALRRLLYWAMAAEEFVVIDCEWWHFELGTRRWAAITGNEPFYGAAEAPTC
jgi:D-alanyl-D-alanine dipeptidase